MLKPPGRRPGQSASLLSADAQARTSNPADRRFMLIIAATVATAALITFFTLAWGNPMPLGSDGFWLIARMRATTLGVIALVAFAQATATIAFQTVTTNRILTPSIMGFESLYRLVQTLAVFVLGAAGLAAVSGVGQFLGQVALMVGFAAVLYGWLFVGRRGNLHVTLLVGLVLGTALGSASTFVQRLLTPSEFDVLTARLIGSLANADAALLPAAVPLAGAAGAVLWARSRELNVLALGRETALNLGVDHQRATLRVLLLTATLMATSTALVGPMTFLGFLVAMLTYQLADTYDHRLLFPLGALLGFVVLAGAHLVLKHAFYAEGSVGVIIELVGGTAFLIHLLRKGRL